MSISERPNPGEMQALNEGFSPLRENALKLMQEHAQSLRQGSPEAFAQRNTVPAGTLGMLEITGDDSKLLPKPQPGNVIEIRQDDSGDGKRKDDGNGDKPAKKSDEKGGDKPSDKPSDKADDSKEQKQPEKTVEEQKLEEFEKRYKELKDAEKTRKLADNEKNEITVFDKFLPVLRDKVAEQHEKRYEDLAKKVKDGTATPEEKKELEGRQKEHDELEKKVKDYEDLTKRVLNGPALSDVEQKRLNALHHEKAVHRCQGWMHSH
jgi:hypothetical protein